MLLGLMGIFFILFQASSALAGWRQWPYRFYQWEEKIREDVGWWMGRNIGYYLTRPLGPWEAFMSDFDPIGRALYPLEERIPGLDIRGKIKHTTRIATHGNIRDGLFLSRVLVDPSTNRPLGIDPTTGRLVPAGGSIRPIRSPNGLPAFPTKASHQDPNLHEASFLTELEFDYKPNPWLRFDLILQYRYDAAYDWDSRFRQFYKGNRVRLEHQGYRDIEDHVLRELFFTFWRGSWEITLGKQQVAWGKLITRVGDFINPDFLTVGIDEEGRNPLWMANFLYYWGDWKFQYIFTPDYESALPLDGARSAPRNREGVNPLSPVRVLRYRESRPGDGFDDASHGFRIGFERAGWEADLSYYYTWTTDSLLGGTKYVGPVFVRGSIGPLRRGRPDRRTNPIFVFLQKKHTRIHHIGFDLAKTFYFWYRDWSFKIEGVYTINPYISVASGAREPWLRSITNPRGWIKKDGLATALEISSKLFRDFSWTFTWIQTSIYPYDSLLRTGPIGEKVHRMDHLFTFAVMKRFYEAGRCNIRFAWFHDGNGNGRFDTSFTYKISSYMNFGVSFRDYYGKNKDTSFGEKRNMGDFVRLNLTYTF